MLSPVLLGYIVLNTILRLMHNLIAYSFHTLVNMSRIRHASKFCSFKYSAFTDVAAQSLSRRNNYQDSRYVCTTYFEYRICVALRSKLIVD